MKNSGMTALLCLLLALCLCPAAMAEEAPRVDAITIETSSEAMDEILGAMNWQMPNGYTLEAFTRGDLSHDGQADSVVSSLLLKNDGVSRFLAVLIANPFSQHVYYSTTALPKKDMGVDRLLGFSSEPGYFTIHVERGEQVLTRVGYTFGYHGSHFYLDNVFVTQWDTTNLSATEQAFHLDTGRYVARKGVMRGDMFVSESTEAQHQFDPAQIIIALEDFDIADFPLDWASFSAMINVRETPTARPTSKPRPTYQPMPGPVYPSEMPGPVYPTDMPMPGPVYPTEPPWDGTDVGNGE